MLSFRAVRKVLPLALLGALCMSQAHATITIITPFINYENDAPNSVGFKQGQYLRFGANSVTSTVPGVVTGTWSTSIWQGPPIPTYSLPQTSSPLLPNMFQGYLDRTAPYYVNNPTLANSLFTLGFTNGTDSASTTVTLGSSAVLLPYVNSITLSGSSLSPTFSWTPPPGTTPGGNVNGYRVNIFDKSLIAPGNNGQVTSNSFSYTQTSFTIQPSDFTLPGYQFSPTGHYVIQISALQTVDGSDTNFSNSNIESFSRVYADFTPTPDGAPVVNLPVVQIDGAYQFNMAVVPGQTYYIDPAVATGYQYAIGAGDPNFATVTLPTGIAGNFELWGKDGQGNLFLITDLAGGQQYSFGDGGVDFFEVSGISPSAGLNPGNTTAFITGLTFVSAGIFDGTQTPIVTNVPEPESLTLVGLGLVMLVVARPKRQKHA